MACTGSAKLKPKRKGRGTKIDFGIKLTKKDIVTIILISIVFFGIAAWNVGAISIPTTTWQNTQNRKLLH